MTSPGTVPDPVRAGDAVREARRQSLRRAVVVVFGMWVCGYVGVTLIADLAFALNASPLGRLCIALGVLAAPGLWCVLLLRRRRYFVILVATLVLTLAMALVPWSTRKLFVHDLMSIDPGMTVAEVEAAMDGWGYGFRDKYARRPDDWPRGVERATFTGRLGYRWTSGLTADWGHVHFVDGRATGVNWSPD